MVDSGMHRTPDSKYGLQTGNSVGRLHRQMPYIDTK